MGGKARSICVPGTGEGGGSERLLVDERIMPLQCRDATACIAESPQSRTLDVETKPSSRESFYVAEAVSVCEHAQIGILFLLSVRLPSIDRNVIIATPSSWSLSVKKERRSLRSLAVGGSEQPRFTEGSDDVTRLREARSCP